MLVKGPDQVQGNSAVLPTQGRGGVVELGQASATSRRDEKVQERREDAKSSAEEPQGASAGAVEQQAAQ